MHRQRGGEEWNRLKVAFKLTETGFYRAVQRTGKAICVLSIL